MFCAIWYILYNLKNVKNTHGGVLLLVKLQAHAKHHICQFFIFRNQLIIFNDVTFSKFLDLYPNYFLRFSRTFNNVLGFLTCNLEYSGHFSLGWRLAQKSTPALHAFVLLKFYSFNISQFWPENYNNIIWTLQQHQRDTVTLHR